MKSGLAKGLIVAALQLAIVGSLAAKFEHDRVTCPRVWVKTGYYDPNLPIRGRYVSLQLEIDAPGLFEEKPLVEDKRNPGLANLQPQPSTNDASKKPRYIPVWDYKKVHLEVRDGKLLAISDPTGNVSARYVRNADGQPHVFLEEPVNFYVSEHAANLPQWEPRRQTEWWAEVTVPKKGPPRPLRLGIKQADGQILAMPAG
jgi:hypothetical protein